MKRIITILIAFAMMLSFAACANKSTSSDEGKLQVYTSFYAMYDFARQIGGDMADVHILCPPGQEPHDFEPTAQDMARLSEADVFIYNGGGMEHWAESVTATLPETVKVIEASQFAKHKAENNDPHVWLNPKNAYSQLEAIADAFIEKDPENKNYYEKQLAECDKNIKHLRQDMEIAKGMFKSHIIVVSHDAYSHLCDVYDISSICINGKDNSGEPSPQRLADIERFIRDNNIKYIFTEPLGTSDVVKTLANDTGCEILVLDPFEGSSEDKGYITAMIENIAVLTQALN